MIFEHTEAFRIKFMGTSKSWIQVLKTRWAGPRPAQGRLTFDSENENLKINHKEARKKYSDRYKSSRMIIESIEAFRILFITDFKH